MASKFSLKGELNREGAKCNVWGVSVSIKRVSFLPYLCYISDFDATFIFSFSGLRRLTRAGEQQGSRTLNNVNSCYLFIFVFR